MSAITDALPMPAPADARGAQGGARTAAADAADDKQFERWLMASAERDAAPSAPTAGKPAAPRTQPRDSDERGGEPTETDAETTPFTTDAAVSAPPSLDALVPGLGSAAALLSDGADNRGDLDAINTSAIAASATAPQLSSAIAATTPATATAADIDPATALPGVIALTIAGTAPTTASAATVPTASTAQRNGPAQPATAGIAPTLLPPTLLPPTLLPPTLLPPILPPAALPTTAAMTDSAAASTTSNTGTPPPASAAVTAGVAATAATPSAVFAALLGAASDSTDTPLPTGIKAITGTATDASAGIDASRTFALPPSIPATADPRTAAAITTPLPLSAPDFAEQLGTRMVWMAEQNIGHARINISPDQLGPVEIRLRLDGDRVHAQFISASADVRQTLEASLPRLRDMLGAHGFNLAQADVGAQPQSNHSGTSGGFGQAQHAPAESTFAHDIAVDVDSDPLPAPLATRASRLLDTYA